MDPALNKRKSERPTIDWEELYQRLETARKSLESQHSREHEVRTAILRSRAQSLARENIKEGMTGEYLEVIEFLLAGERYCLESSCVQEVYPLRELVPVPGTPDFILGVTNVRGKILSVIDIKKYFELPDKGLNELDKIIIVQFDGLELGIRADAILGVRSLPLEEIQPSLPTLTGTREKYIKGITRDSAAVLNIEALLTDKSIIIHEEVE